MGAEWGSQSETSAVHPKRTQLFIVRTTAGQEVNVALMAELRARNANLAISSIVAIPELKGYVVFETNDLRQVYEAVRGIKHVRGRVSGTITIDDIEKFVKPKPIIEMLEVGMEVEVIAGPLRGARAKITAINKARNEVSLSVLEAEYPLTVTVPVEYIRPAKK